tara:strand:+ start:947 stop:1138 length:192 start_codon:yes stop_codon:yes gene_type:complete
MDNYHKIKELNKEIKHLDNQIFLYQESIENFKKRKTILFNQIDKLCSHKNREGSFCYDCGLKF